MADEKTVSVRLMASSDLFKKAMLDAQGSVKSLAGNVEGQFKKIANSANQDLGKASGSASMLGTRMMSIGAAAAALGAGMIAVGFKMANAFENVGKEVIKLQRYTGLSAEEASKLRFAAQQSGIDVDKLTRSLGMMSRQMLNAPDKFAALGISIRGANGQMRSTSDVLLDVADKVANTTNATERLQIAQTAFGRSGADMLPMLMRGRDGLSALADQAEKYGLVLTQDNVNAVKGAIAAHRQFDAAVQGLQVSIGQKFLPILTSVTEGLAGLMSGAHGVAGEFVFWGGISLTVAGTLTMIGVKAVSAGAAFLEATAAMRAFAAAEWAAAGGAAALAAPLAIVAAAVVATGVAANHASNEAKKGATEARDSIVAASKSDTWDQLMKRIDDTKAAYEDAYNSANPLIRKNADEIGNAADAMIAYANRANDLAAAVGISSEQALAWLNSQAALGREFTTTGDAITTYTGKLDTTGMTTEDVTAAIKAQQDALKALNDELHASFDPLFAMQRSLRANEDAQQKVTDSQLAAFFAEQQLNDLRKNHPKDAAAIAQAERDLADAQRAVTDAQSAAAASALDVTTAANTLKTAIDTGTLSVEDSQAQLQTWVAQGLLTEDQAKAVAQQFGWAGLMADALNNKNVQPKVTTPQNLDDLIAKFGTLANLYDRLNRPLPAYLNPDAPAYGNGLGVLAPQRAAGGPVSAGTRYRVAEQGQELYASARGMALLSGPYFTPQDSGHIYTAAQTTRLMHGGAAMVTGGGGGVNVNLTVNAQGMDPVAIRNEVMAAVPDIKRELRQSDRAGV